MSRRRGPGTGQVFDVLVEIGGENSESGTDEPNDAVGVVAGATPIYRLAAFYEALVRAGRVGQSARQLGEVARQRGQSERAWSALSRALVGHPSDHPLGFEHAAAVNGEARR